MKYDDLIISIFFGANLFDFQIIVSLLSNYQFKIDETSSLKLLIIDIMFDNFRNFARFIDFLSIFFEYLTVNVLFKITFVKSKYFFISKLEYILLR